MKNFLPALIVLPLALIAGFAARSSFQPAIPAPAREAAAAPAAVRAEAPGAPLERSAPVEKKDESRAAGPGPSSAPATAPAPLPVPPTTALERAEELQQWLVELPSTDMARLAGTAEMDAYVGQVIGYLQSSASTDRNATDNVDRFLKQINASILQAKSSR